MKTNEEIRKKYIAQFGGSGGNKSTERFPYREINVDQIQNETRKDTIEQIDVWLRDNSTRIPMEDLNDLLAKLNELKGE